MSESVPPFYSNYADGKRCVVAVFRMVFEHVLDRSFSNEQIEKIGRYSPNKGSWTIPYLLYLQQFNVDIINIEPFEYEIFARDGINYLSKIFDSQNVDYYLNHSNLFELKELIPDFVTHIKTETRKAQLADIDRLLAKEYLVAVELNSGELNDEDFNIHMILIYDKDATGNYLAHDPGFPAYPKRSIAPQSLTWRKRCQWSSHRN